MRIPITLALPIAVLLATPVHAQDCANAATQMEMDACAGQSYKKSDAELNAVYKEVRGRLQDDADARNLLLAAQRAWLAFRDSECAFSASGTTGGSVYPMVVTQCKDGLTQDRSKALRAYLNCQEGDLSCPVPGKSP